MAVVPLRGLGAENRGKMAASLLLPNCGRSKSVPRTMARQCHLAMLAARKSGESWLSLPASIVKGSVDPRPLEGCSTHIPLTYWAGPENVHLYRVLCRC